MNNDFVDGKREDNKNPKFDSKFAILGKVYHYPRYHVHIYIFMYVVIHEWDTQPQKTSFHVILSAPSLSTRYIIRSVFAFSFLLIVTYSLQI